MRVMKCILISFIAVSLVFKGVIQSVIASDTAGEIERLEIELKIHGMFKRPGLTDFMIKAKPLTVNEQVSLKNIESKTHTLLNQAAGRFYDDSYENSRLNAQPPFINHPIALDIIRGAVLGTFIGWLASSGKDIPSVRKSTQIGAMCGAAIISVLYIF